MNISEFTRKLRACEPVSMVNVGGRNPDVMPILKKCGADAAFIDCERSGIGLDVASELIVSARASGIPAVVRSHTTDGPGLLRFLDRGADGLVVPHIQSVDEVMRCVELMRYFAGSSTPLRSLIIQVETRSAIDQIEAISSLANVDGFLLGPNDIGYEWNGCRGSHSTESIAAIDHVCQTLRGKGRSFGYPARDQELEKFVEHGANLRYLALDWLISSGWTRYSEAP